MSWRLQPWCSELPRLSYWQSVSEPRRLALSLDAANGHNRNPCDAVPEHGDSLSERTMAEEMETKSASRPGGWPSRLPMHLRLRSALLEALLMMKENTTLKDGAICVQYKRDRVLESVCKC